MNTTGFITDLKAWIDNNLEEKLDINTVADRAGYSKWHLQRMFKRQTGYALGSISACKTESVGGAPGQQRRAYRQRGDFARLRLTAVVQPQLQTPIWPNAGRLAPRVGAAGVHGAHAPLSGWAVGIKSLNLRSGFVSLPVGIQKLAQLPDFATVSLSRQNMRIASLREFEREGVQ